MTRLLMLSLVTLMGCGGVSQQTDGGPLQGGAGPAHFFLPTADQVRNTTGARIAKGRDGTVHMVYPAYSHGDAFYASCSGACDSENAVKSVRLPTDTTVENVLVAVGSDDKPRVLIVTREHAFYAQCIGDCSLEQSWRIDAVLDFPAQDREVSGEAFALSPGDRPRFMMHTFRTYLGVNQKDPATWFVTCDANCSSAASWTSGQIATQNWTESSLVIDAQGLPHAATVAQVGAQNFIAFVECTAADCTKNETWAGSSLVEAFVDRYVAEIDPAVALTRDANGALHVAGLALNDQQKANVVYLRCDSNCAEGASWHGRPLSSNPRIGAGVDVSTNAAGTVFVAYTVGGSIFVTSCGAGCTATDSVWKLDFAENADAMPADQIMPYPNCTVGMWFLRKPSMAIGADGSPRLGYQAMDISGGTRNPDPTAPQCQAGLDMTFARFTRL